MNRALGFGFVTLDSTDAVDMVVTAKYHQINGKTVLKEIVARCRPLVDCCVSMSGGSKKGIS